MWHDGVDGDPLSLALDSEGRWSPTCRGKKESPSRQESSTSKVIGMRKCWSRGNIKKEEIKLEM